VFQEKIGRRELLRRSLFASGSQLLRFDKAAPTSLLLSQEDDIFASGEQLGSVEFLEQLSVPMETGFGEGLDGRLYTDLSKLGPPTVITPTESFYVRTRASELLPGRERWTVRLNGLLTRSFELPIDGLEKSAKPMGMHLMECAGNARTVHFGLISAAEWTGVQLSDLVESAQPKSHATCVRVSGFDTYPSKSLSSQAGASWVFTREELRVTRAFLAIEMNGQSLTRDHGAPVRLVVPGWYGCACIKWVNEITLVDKSVESTSQMQEFAERTHQPGVPKMVRDYKPATIEQAAMPTRIEKWLVGERILYRLKGIAWGGAHPVSALEIRFNPDEDYVPVESFSHQSNDPWSFWTHTWTPKRTGTYLIRLRAKDPQVLARRMNAGYYLRAVNITET
jgi:DMSO/TMAO reductase YedYZ molybdopterin-dependent catalytic subunit